MPDPFQLVVSAAADLDRVGWTTLDPFPEVEESIRSRVASGRSAGLGFTFTDAAVAASPRVTWPWAESIVVGLRAYLPDAGTPAGVGRIARFAEQDHYAPLREALDRVAAALTAAGHRAEVVIDDSRLVDRAVAHRAGMAWWGRNTMLITPGLGPWFLIGSVVTDAEFPSVRPDERTCGSCTACLPACPTGALVEPGILDARRCLAAVLQQPGPIPVELRAAVGDRLYGCDDCLEACPPGSRLLAAGRTDRGTVDPRAVLSAGERELQDRFGHFYLPGRRLRWLRRNAIVVLGNTGSDDDLTLLAGYLSHPDGMLVEHAVWAIGAIGGSVADRILAQLAPPIGK